VTNPTLWSQSPIGHLQIPYVPSPLSLSTTPIAPHKVSKPFNDHPMPTLLAMITTSRLITLCTVLCAILVAVSSAPVQTRDVYVPPVLYPHNGTVWKVGSYHNVTWYGCSHLRSMSAPLYLLCRRDTSNPPANITNKKGIIVLAKAGRLNYGTAHSVVTTRLSLDPFGIQKTPFSVASTFWPAALLYMSHVSSPLTATR
jgi:hypothetical protein